ncbi:ferredoxin [Clostridia bacterium]|nr:ferredoxin [Clostridia bacterium]
MSIEISDQKCTGCGLCVKVCPGSLIESVNGKSLITDPRRCWGCASCVKECPAEAISLYLGEDIGGRGGKLTVRTEGSLLYWTVHLPDGTAKTIITDRAQSNKY